LFPLLVATEVSTLATFHFEHRHKLIYAQETNSYNAENPGPYQVAKHIDTRGNYDLLPDNHKKYAVDNHPETGDIRWDLGKLTSDQIQQLTANFGVKKQGSASSFQCCLVIQRHNVMSDVYDNNDIINPHVTGVEKKYNTLLRMINTVFSSEFIDDFIHLNDAKRRKDFEEAHGGSPVKAFWHEIAEYHNNATNNADIGIMSCSMEDEDKHLFDLGETESVDLRNCDQLNHMSAAQCMSDMMKCPATIQIAIKASGHHSDNMWTYLNKKFLTPRAYVAVTPGAAVYCLDIMCSKNDAIDSAFCETLAGGAANSHIGFAKGDAASKGKNGKGDFLSALKQLNVKMESAINESSEQRKEHMRMKKTEKEKENITNLWSECRELSEAANGLMHHFQSAPVLRNLHI